MTGSDPNIQEGVTTLVAELMREWIVNEVQPLDSDRMLSALGWVAAVEVFGFCLAVIPLQPAEFFSILIRCVLSASLADCLPVFYFAFAFTAAAC